MNTEHPNSAQRSTNRYYLSPRKRTLSILVYTKTNTDYPIPSNDEYTVCKGYDPIYRLNLLNIFVTALSQGLDFQRHMSWWFILGFSENLGADCLFSWYLWNCRPSQFKLSFHKSLNKDEHKESIPEYRWTQNIKDYTKTENQI